MKLMTRLFIRNGIVVVTLTLYCALSSGCSLRNEKPAGDDLDLALAGMTGSDGVTFEGATALLRGSDGTPYETLYYGGKVKDHNQVTLYTLLPDSNSSKAAATGKINKLGSAIPNKQSYYSQLKKIGGQWQPLSQSFPQEGNPLPRLNPIYQLEELEGMDKTVTEEAGAGRGTRVLRIELSPDEAHAQLAAQLNQEMSALRSFNQTGEESQSSANPQLNKALETYWKKQNTELQRKLDKAHVETVYHLNVDVKRNLPKRLAWTRTINFPGDIQKTRSETYVTQIDFYGYR
ncbi:hypothetical protein PaeBR_16355 [Paenibacillus sp. BR2-3]|uniref:hypothetical protein n=1 Tax=Paenibacillus sp. BR2-3 TaxID=3048494 RepID=UPI003977B16C